MKKLYMSHSYSVGYRMICSNIYVYINTCDLWIYRYFIFNSCWQRHGPSKRPTSWCLSDSSRARKGPRPPPSGAHSGWPCAPGCYVMENHHLFWLIFGFLSSLEKRNLKNKNKNICLYTIYLFTYPFLPS